jgi:HNH endonuclease
MTKKLVSLERAREVLEYDQTTGILRWRITLSNKARAGRIAGAENGNGYLRVGIDGRLYLAHRIAWLIQTGSWPTDDIDHRDLNKANNKWGNLRDATRGQNNANRRAQRNKLVALKGVTSVKKKTKRFRAQINVRGHVRHLGCFATAEEAHAAFLQESKRQFGSFVRVE